MTAMPPACVLSAARTSAGFILDDLCTIIEPGTPSRDAGGGIVDGTPTETTDVPCHLGPLGMLNPVELDVNGKLTLVNPAKILFAYDQVISQQAQIRFETTGEVYEVRGFIPRGSSRIFLEAVCERIR